MICLNNLSKHIASQKITVLTRNSASQLSQKHWVHWWPYHSLHRVNNQSMRHRWMFSRCRKQMHNTVLHKKWNTNALCGYFPNHGFVFVDHCSKGQSCWLVTQLLLIRHISFPHVCNVHGAKNENELFHFILHHHDQVGHKCSMNSRYNQSVSHSVSQFWLVTLS